GFRGRGNQSTPTQPTVTPEAPGVFPLAELPAVCEILRGLCGLPAGSHDGQDQADHGDDRADDRPERDAAHGAAADNVQTLQCPQDAGEDEEDADHEKDPLHTSIYAHRDDSVLRQRPLLRAEVVARRTVGQRPASNRLTALSTSRWSVSCPRGTALYVRRRKRTSTLRGTSKRALPSGEESARATKSPRGPFHGQTRTSPMPAGSSSPVKSSSRAKDQLTGSPPADSAWKSTWTA